ncbi:hypothetical protein B9Z65_3616 [Elsinoe australis]|uniref:Uncharacterized protein n=1 Tax=Elsinoe australis TaxID=40998 RepID=A0A2P8AFQ4_9PEZI|nr:hypothetical protein B9Z65_3616 [Elsinoe australis]
MSHMPPTMVGTSLSYPCTTLTVVSTSTLSVVQPGATFYPTTVPYLVSTVVLPLILYLSKGLQPQGATHISYNDIAGGSSGSSSSGSRRWLDHYHHNDFGEYDDFHNFDCHKWRCCHYYGLSALGRRDKLCDDKCHANSDICTSQYEHVNNESNRVNCNRDQLDDVRRHFLARRKRSDSYCEHNYIVNVDHQQQRRRISFLSSHGQRDLFSDCSNGHNDDSICLDTSINPGKYHYYGGHDRYCTRFDIYRWSDALLVFRIYYHSGYVKCWWYDDVCFQYIDFKLIRLVLWIFWVLGQFHVLIYCIIRIGSSQLGRVLRSIVVCQQCFIGCFNGSIHVQLRCIFNGDFDGDFFPIDRITDCLFGCIKLPVLRFSNCKFCCLSTWLYCSCGRQLRHFKFRYCSRRTDEQSHLQRHDEAQHHHHYCHPLFVHPRLIHSARLDCDVFSPSIEQLK